jgi:hypothetical protein
MTHHTFGERKSKFTPSARQVILDAIRRGRSMNEAAMEAATTYRNLVRWRHLYVARAISSIPTTLQNRHEPLALWHTARCR